ncbi:hypothetical protein PZ938_16580 [Luteipulveratus sp. YIM 133132]|uniref:hypothetical protein n=1 Tax=Luteipulveratus flavus TaxID=3031728 RepID=UPI0023B02E04|nr:hypothetical protein [Luteipulveratus sp. YIM 133132]MDE9367237.1 hypothetical protein [Luteipulveratus sp. YIM 133132]
MSLTECGLPPIDAGQPIRDAVIDLTEAAGAIHTHAGTIARGWTGLAHSYHAPEQHLVLQAMSPAETHARDAEALARKAGSALITYANRCDELRRTKSVLAGDIRDHNARHEDRGGSLLDKAARWTGIDELGRLAVEEALLNRCNQLQADLDEAQRTCANALGRLYSGGAHYEAVGQTTVTDPTVYGLTADGYGQLARAGDTPWGTPAAWQHAGTFTQVYLVGRGGADSVVGLVGLVGDLAQVGTTGESRAAWSGLWQLTTDLGTVANPAALPATLLGVGPAGEARARLWSTAKAGMGWDTWGTSPYYTAGGFLPDALSAYATGGGSLAGRTALKGALGAAARRLPVRATTVERLASAQRALTSSAGRLNTRALDNVARLNERLPSGPRPAHAGAGHGWDAPSGPPLSENVWMHRADRPGGSSGLGTHDPPTHGRSDPGVYARKTVRARTAALDALLKDWKGMHVTVGQDAIGVTRESMHHFLERHHPRYWDGSIKDRQSFLDPETSLEEMERLIRATLFANRHSIANTGSHYRRLQARIDGATWVMAIDHGYVRMFYPRKKILS